MKWIYVCPGALRRANERPVSLVVAAVAAVLLSAPSPYAAAGAGAVPDPWQTGGVGDAKPAGSASYASGTFTVEGSAGSIGGSADQFQFVYRTLDGDGEMVARVRDVERTHPWAKAGVMFRDGLAAGAAHAFAFVAAGQGSGFEFRATPSASSSQTTTGVRATPAFVKLTRRGNTFTAFMSLDGSTWTEMGRQNIGMSSRIYVGLAASSRTNRSTSTAIFDQVTVTTGGAPTDPEPDPEPEPDNQAPTVTLSAPANGATYTAPATVPLAANASDRDGTIARVEFYAGTTRVGSDSSAPYTASWSTNTPGSYVLSAVAYDNAGAATTSASVAVTVAAAPPPLPRYVAFSASADHDTSVTGYVVEFFTAGLDPDRATPVAARAVGKPAPVNGEIQVDVASVIESLPQGTYVATVVATGGAGSSRSAPSAPFDR